jgi:hypothetical protein
MNRRLRAGLLLIVGACVSGCATIPQSAEQGVIEIKNVTAAIECELAAVAADPRFSKRELASWKALTDLDLSLLTSVGADAKPVATAPFGLAVLSLSPSLGASRKDSSVSHVQFATPIARAKAVYGATCAGPDPSGTRMGLAEWFRSALIAVDKNTLTGLTFTKEFDISANAGTRFGYTLLPVANTVTTDSGGGLSVDRTNRMSIALAPPHEVPPHPIAVYVVDGPESLTKDKHPATEGAKHGKPAKAEREHSVRDPTLQYLLQRRSPIKVVP